MKKRLLALLLCVALCVPNSLISMAAQSTDVTAVDAEETGEACEECQQTEGHLETCSKYVAPEDDGFKSESSVCEECQAEEGHLETCSQYVNPEEVTECEECKQTEGHLANCSQYVEPEEVTECEECKQPEGHLEICSQYVKPEEETGCEECKQTEGHLETCSQYTAPEKEAPLCEKCNAVEGEDGNIVHEETCELYIPVEALLKDMLMATTSTSEMYELVLEYMNNEVETLLALTAEEIAELREYIAELDPEIDDIDTADLLDTLAVLPNGGEELVGNPVVLANNVHNKTQNKWYDTLSAATETANDNDVIEVHNSFTETASVKIQKENLTIRAAEGQNPTISWIKTDNVTVPGATPYHCVVIYTDVTTSTTFGGSNGTLTFDASQASNDDHKGKRARVMMHCGKGTLYLKDGIVLTGGNPGGGKYDDDKSVGPFPDFSGEIVGEVGFGAGIFMRYGTLNMDGGVIKDNYTLWGATAEDRKTSHNYYGGASGSNGGGAYVKDGNVTIGIANCNGSDTNHTITMTDKIHPVIENNTAVDSGGGIALFGEGNIVMYCGKVADNSATNKGRGLNVYMESGDFQYFNGAKVGAPEDPEVVIVGGNLKKMNSNEGEIDLLYHHCNDREVFPDNHQGELADKKAIATKSSYFNLPDGEKYWDAPEGYRFFGWTFYGPNDEEAPEHVRNKSHYKPLGEPIKTEDIYDGINTDDTIEMHALWAPETSSITYAGNVINSVYTEEELNVSNPTTYSFSVSEYTIELNSPEKSGYTFLGWYYYQNEGKNANWGIEPNYKEGTSESDKSYSTLDYSESSSMGFLPVANDGKCHLVVEVTNFGDLTMIAKFEPAYADLEITKKGADLQDANQSFLFHISGIPDNIKLPAIDMTVTIQGNGNITIEDLPVGKYTITELTDWSWRYKKQDPQNITLSDPETTEEVKFVNEREDDKWFSEDCYCENWWDKSDNNNVEKR